MKQHTFTEASLRKLVVELLNDPTSGAIYAPEEPNGVKVNPVVDPSAALSDPMNPDYKPQNATELGVAVRQITRSLPDEQASRIYDQIKSSIDAQAQKDADAAAKLDADEAKENTEMDDNNTTVSGTKKGTHSGTQAEAIVRKMVRNILREEKAPADDEEVALNNIAKEFGMSVAGAKQLVDKALARYHFLDKFINDPDDQSKALKPKQSGDKTVVAFDPSETGINNVDVMILKAWAEYIKLLSSSNELTPADVQLMHDHPEVALELDGFREYLSEYIMGSAQPVDKKGAPWLGSLPDDVDPNLKPFDQNKPNKKRSGKRTFQNAPDFKGDFEWFDDDEEKASKIQRKAASRVIRGSQGE